MLANSVGYKGNHQTNFNNNLKLAESHHQPRTIIDNK